MTIFNKKTLPKEELEREWNEFKKVWESLGNDIENNHIQKYFRGWILRTKIETTKKPNPKLLGRVQ